MVETAIPLRPAGAAPVTPKKADPTNQLRQRRHRAKKKAQSVTLPVPPATLAPAEKSKETKAKLTTVTPARRHNAAAKALRRQTVTAAGVGLVAVILTALSLSHLAHGIGIVTHADAWEAWAMAIGIDLGFIALELSQLAIGEKVRRQVSRFARPAIFGTLAGSAAMNAFGFASQAEGYVMVGLGVGLGVAIPAMVYALTKVGALVWMDAHARA